GSAAPPPARSTSGCWRSWRCPARGRGAAGSDGRGGGRGQVGEGNDEKVEGGMRRPAPAGFSRSLQNRCSCLCCSPGGAAACCDSGSCHSAWTFWDSLRLVSHWTLLRCWVCPP
ncbi:hypothetical protein N300_01886, partial [Calypte anna]